MNVRKKFDVNKGNSVFFGIVLQALRKAPSRMVSKSGSASTISSSTTASLTSISLILSSIS